MSEEGSKTHPMIGTKLQTVVLFYFNSVCSSLSVPFSAVLSVKPLFPLSTKLRTDTQIGKFSGDNSVLVLKENNVDRRSLK